MALISPTLVKTCVEIGKLPGTNLRDWIGTGILYGDRFMSDVHQNGGYIMPYLFTNRHVIEQLMEGKLNPSQEIAIRLINRESGQAGVHPIPLFDPQDQTKLWISHPVDEIDVAVISLNLWGLVGDHDFYLAERTEGLVLDEMRHEGCTEGDPVFVIGYPYSIRNLPPGVRMYPVVRSGVISRITNAFASECETYLIDATIYPGNSGGPVILQPTHEFQHVKGTRGSKKSALIGMVSGYLEYQDEAVSSQTGNSRMLIVDNSGLAVVQTVDSMLATLNLLKAQIGHKFPTGQPPPVER